MNNPIKPTSSGKSLIEMCQTLQNAREKGTLSKDQKDWMDGVQARGLQSNYAPPTDVVELRNPPRFVED